MGLLFFEKGDERNRTAIKGFADPCIAIMLHRRRIIIVRTSLNSISPFSQILLRLFRFGKHQIHDNYSNHNHDEQSRIKAHKALSKKIRMVTENVFDVNFNFLYYPVLRHRINLMLKHF